MRDWLQHFLIPRHTNNHRPKALHVDTLTVYAVIMLIVNVLIRTVHMGSPMILGYATDIYADQLLASTNQKRQEAGLGTLTMNGQLSQAAAAKAQDMFAQGYWAHNSPSGKTPWDFISQAGYRYTIAGENLAKNFSTSQAVVDAWMASPSHRDNILKDGYREVGFAVVNGVLNGEETTLVVQMFGAGSGSVAVRPAAEATPKPPTPTSIPEPTKAVEVPVVESETEESTPVAVVRNPSPMPPIVASAFSGISIRPLLDIPTLTRGIAYLFLGILLVAFIIDAVVISRKRIVRMTGSSIAHTLFFAVLVVLITYLERGSVL